MPSAALRVLLCRNRHYGYSLGSASREHLPETCAATVRFVPGRYRLQDAVTGGEGTFNEIMLEVTPSQRGTVQVDGVRIRYHRSDRSGDEMTGSRVEVQSP